MNNQRELQENLVEKIVTLEKEVLFWKTKATRQEVLLNELEKELQNEN
jgi:hypothetical protein